MKWPTAMVWIAVAVLALGFGRPATAETITIVCQSPSGWAFGYEHGPSPAIETDRFRDATFSYTWKTGSPSATVITQSTSSLGLAPWSEQAAVISSPRYIAFIITYERGIWMHTFMMASSVMLIAKHTDGRGTFENSAAASVFHVRCDAGIR